MFMGEEAQGTGCTDQGRELSPPFEGSGRACGGWARRLGARRGHQALTVRQPSLLGLTGLGVHAAPVEVVYEIIEAADAFMPGVSSANVLASGEPVREAGGARRAACVTTSRRTSTTSGRGGGCA
jgi:hypothetical protein